MLDAPINIGSLIRFDLIADRYNQAVSQGFSTGDVKLLGNGQILSEHSPRQMD